MVSLRILFILIISYTTITSHRLDEVSKLVQDVIENEGVASVILAKTCWPKLDEFNLVKDSSFPIQIIKSNSSIEKSFADNTNKQWFFVDANCSDTSEFLSIINETFFAHPYRWIIIDAVNDTIQHRPFLPGSNIIIANKDSNSKQYILKQVYKIGKETSLIYENFGTWNIEKGIVDLRVTRVLSRRRRNLNGYRLIAPMVFTKKGSENFTDLDDYHHNKVDSTSKLSYQLTKYWVESINATIEGDVHRTWGYRDKKTGVISGMVGQLERKEADIGGTIIFMTIERLEYLDYLSMTIPSKIAFILRAPPLSYISNIYYLPFSGTVWLCSISLVVLCTIFIAFTLKLSWCRDEGTEHLRASDYFLFAIASSCQMGNDILTTILSARISMFVFFVALLFIYTSFTAMIVALLQSTTQSIKSVADLQNPAIGIGVQDNVYNRHYFAAQTEPSRKKLYETKVTPQNNPEAFMNLSHGISRMREGMFAFHVVTAQGYDEIERTFYENEKCGLVEISYLGNVDTWTVAQKQSPYKEILKVNIMKIREHGIQTREQLRIYTTRPKCDGKNFGSVRLADCHWAVLIFVYGCIISFLLFCIEKFIKETTKMRKIQCLMENNTIHFLKCNFMHKSK
ncbi:ionotropic receptor 75a-like [Contarinia nasturtii]|uniref:ionotropic receptor 75a-like n=1 Tax=Contarinia nasturtii TaxID=265458 RepID=UPI0012D38625|nr:ionotropic receptor 75a-like [Contarinia nasturtii]